MVSYIRPLAKKRAAARTMLSPADRRSESLLTRVRASFFARRLRARASLDDGSGKREISLFVFPLRAPACGKECAVCLRGERKRERVTDARVISLNFEALKQWNWREQLPEFNVSRVFCLSNGRNK